MNEIIVAITGASGVAYAARLLAVLAERSVHVHLLVTEPGALVLERELGIGLDLRAPDLSPLIDPSAGVTYHRHDDIGAPIASGSSSAEAMVVVPCSMDALGAMAAGLSRNLSERAAAVMLKEGRPLIVVPRETPLSTIHLENMLRLARAGACVLPAMPGFYHGPERVEDVVDFVVGKILNRLGIENDLVVWDGE